jgi:hypothetical protein
VSKFDFFKDYTDGIYLKEKTDVMKINTHIQDATVRFHEYFKSAHP